MTLPDAISDIANQSLPKHVAIIMDGNGRWAQQRGKIRVAGHKAGVASVRQVVSTASRMGIKALTLFAFSSENWRRPETEVSALMELFMFVLAREVRKLHDSNIRLRVIDPELAKKYLAKGFPVTGTYNNGKNNFYNS